MPIQPSPPNNYVVSENWLDTVVTTQNLADSPEANKIPVTNSSGKIEESFLPKEYAPIPVLAGTNIAGAVTEVNLTNVNTYTLPSTGKTFFYFLVSRDTSNTITSFCNVGNAGDVVNFPIQMIQVVGFLWRLS